MTREKTQHTDRVVHQSINQSINNQSINRSSFANLFVSRRVRKIASHRRHRVGRRKRPTHRESSSITSRHRITNHIARASPIADRIASHPGMTCTKRARSPARPMVSANHRTARMLAGDASTPTIHARFDMSTTLFFSLFFSSPLVRRGVARWMSPVVASRVTARRRFISLGRDDIARGVSSA